MTEPTEMELRVARAILGTLPVSVDTAGRDLLEALRPDTRVKVLQQARAAIRAMRSPTKEMILAGEDAYSEFEDSSRDTNGTYEFVHRGHEAPTYNAMIDAASPPEDTK